LKKVSKITARKTATKTGKNKAAKPAWYELSPSCRGGLYRFMRQEKDRLFYFDSDVEDTYRAALEVLRLAVSDENVKNAIARAVFNRRWG